MFPPFSVLFVHLAHNFFREVILTFLEAFAHFKAIEADDFEATVRLEHGADVLILILHKGLLKQADFLPPSFR